MECSALPNDSKTSPKLPSKPAPSPEKEAALRFVELFKKAVKGKGNKVPFVGPESRA